MRKIIIIIQLMILSIITCITQAQTYQNATIYTPRGTSVVAYDLVNGELTNQQKLDAKNYWLSYYNNRIAFVSEATRTYNCHAYAWHVTEGGNKVWINAPEQNKYWTDDSYAITTPSLGTKVSFDSDDHSAITTNQQGFLESKWGESPVFRHSISDCPYNTSILTYFEPVPQYPAHCDNCRQDEDETGLDCGGSCPPCGDAPPNRVVNQDNLGIESNALVNLSTSGPLVLSSNNFPFTFIAGNEIALNNGFEITSNTGFSAKTSQKQSELTRNFRKICSEVPNFFSPNGDGINDMYGVHAAGITYIVALIRSVNNRIVKRYEAEVHKDGFIELWDGGNERVGGYGVEIMMTTYEGDKLERRLVINLLR